MRIEYLSAPSERLPAVCVDNTVVWVNSKIQAPLALEEGKPCDIAFQLHAPDLKAKSYPLELMTNHCRSGLLGKVLFQDVQGNKYREIDLKGIGRFSTNIDLNGNLYFEPEPVGEGGRPHAPEGLENLDCALHDAKMAEELIDLGIRASRVIAIIKIHQIIDTYNKPITLKEAIEGGIILSERVPVITVRAYATKKRLVDGISNPQNVEEAKQIVADEFNYPGFLKTENYAEWFAETLGTQVGILHRYEYVHNYLTGHNITLDCRLTDFDSVTKKATKEKIRDDFVEAYKTLCRYYSESFEAYWKTKILLSRFEKKYNDEVRKKS